MRARDAALRLRSKVSLRSADRIAAEVERLGPWLTAFTVGGRRYGGHIDFTADVRLRFFETHCGSARRVLELGSLEGGMTMALAAVPERTVVAVEARPANLARARFLQSVLGVGNVTFVEADLEHVAPAELGTFDAILCSGLLYHLPSPWRLLDGLRATAPHLLLATHYAAVDRADTTIEGVHGHWYGEQGLDDPLSGMSPRSFWMTLPSIVARLQRSGFSVVTLVTDEPETPHGPHVVLAAHA